MMIITIWLPVLLAHLCIDPIMSFPKIHWVGPKPEEKTGILYNKFIYKAVQTVRLNCTDAVKWKTLTIEKGNPVFPNVKVTQTSGGYPPIITVNVTYKPNQFVDEFKIKCIGRYFEDIIHIEQQYPTANVNITSTNATVGARSKVKLSCLADGNPKPVYQWYNGSKKGLAVEIKGANKDSFEITTPEKMSGLYLYQCRARNTLNKAAKWVNSSSWMAVNSSYVPTIITSITPLSSEDPETFTYYESNVTIECSVPKAYYKEFEMKLETEDTKGNPVLPTVFAKVSWNGKTMPAQYEYDIKYFNEQFVPLVKVTCRAKNRKTRVLESSAARFIEQQYKTRNVVISGLKTKVVKAGEILELRCMSDGNPEPDQYQWYNHTKEMTGKTENTLKLATPSGWSTYNVLACGAKNKYNKDMVKSSTERVTSVIPADIECTPPPNKYVDNKLIYQEVSKVNVTCALPIANISHDVEVELTVSRQVVNPVVEGELPNMTFHNNKSLLEIKYPRDVFLNVIDIKCLVKDRITTKSLQQSKIQIVQTLTLRARIEGEKQREVEPGKEVTLSCIGDGNPPPNQYAWYNTTTGVEKKIEKQTQAQLIITAPTRKSSSGTFICAVKNELRNDYVKSGLVRVISIYFPNPKLESTPSSNPESTVSKLIFNEIAKVTVTCSIRMDVVPENMELKFGYAQLEDNAVYPNERATFIQTKNQLSIQYNPNRFIGLVSVWCSTVRNKMTKSRTHIQIEQQYKTQNAKVQYSGMSVIEPGDLVQMECVGDGHPTPKEFEWFNRTKTRDVKLESKTRIMKFIAPKDWFGQIIIVCGTKNEHNKDGIVMSEPVTISSMIVPPPTIDAMPTRVKHDGKLTFVETAKVTLKCNLPSSTPDDIFLEMNVKQRKPGNPVFIHEKVKVNIHGEKQDMRMELVYNKEIFVPSVEVTCASKSRTSSKRNSSTVITIEQEYKTSNVKITNNFGNKEVERGMKMELKCLADGNPTPQYQWYNRTNAGDVKLTNAIKSTFQFMVPKNWSSQNVFVCGVSNKHNKETIAKSEAVAVTSAFLPDPVIDIKPSPTNDSTATKFVYFEQAKLNVKCSWPDNRPPQKVELDILYRASEINPVFGKNGNPEVEKVNKETLEVNYWPNIFIPLINFTCTAKIWNETKLQLMSTIALQVVQLYRTLNVNILDVNGDVMPKIITVDSDEKVLLKCQGDGNPLPQQYQWYNRTKDEDIELMDKTQPSFQLVTPADWHSKSIIVCGTKNKYNKETAKSAAVTVKSRYFPRPVFKSDPPASNSSTSDRLVFMEKTDLTIQCHLPMTPFPSDVYMKIDVENYEKNPVYPKEYLSLRIDQDSLQIFIHYTKFRFISTLNISCRAVDKKSDQIRRSANIVIDQQHKTMNVVIPGARKYKLNSGETVELSCVADGNPKPEFQWYQKRKSGEDIKIENATEHVLKIGMAGLFVCGARNQYNTEIVKAEPITVYTTPPPIFTTIPSPTITSTSDRFVFIEEPRVVVQCKLPMAHIPEELAVMMVLERYERNPIYPDEPTGITEYPETLQMEIVYNKQGFIPVYNISCFVANRKTNQTEISSYILIEQQYKTMNVLIEGDNQIVNEGETVILNCTADGNPKPEYQWYNKTEQSDDFKLKNETQAVLKFETPYSWSTVGIYTCGAKNKHNLHIKKGNPVTVTSVFLPPVEIQITPTPNSTINNKFGFYEEPVVTVSCFLSMPVDLPHFVKLSMEYSPTSKPDDPNSKPFTTITMSTKKNITMEIKYKPNTYVPLSDVTCEVENNRNRVKQITKIQIEQQCMTRNVKIQGEPQVYLKGGAATWLFCSADGNPSPRYQWFTETPDGFEALNGVERDTLLFTSFPSTPRITKLMCGARNIYNFEFVTSNIITVILT